MDAETDFETEMDYNYWTCFEDEYHWCEKCPNDLRGGEGLVDLVGESDQV